MPLYSYRCPACNKTEAVWRSIHDPDKPPRCSQSNCRMARDYADEAAGPHTEREFDTPIEMHSIGLTHPDDIDAFRRRHPDVQIGTDPSRDDYGVPKARSRAEKLRILEKEGFEERN